MTYGMMCFDQAGWGAVVMQQGAFKQHENGRIDAVAHYLTTGSHQNLIPDRAYHLAHAYDPANEVVFSLVDDLGQELAFTLKPGQYPAL